MRCIGIIGAMEVEVASLKEQMKDIQVTRKASMEFYAGKKRSCCPFRNW